MAPAADIFFETPAQLIPSDRDQASDVYDARIGGGFSFAETDDLRGRSLPASAATAPSAEGAPGLAATRRRKPTPAQALPQGQGSQGMAGASRSTPKAPRQEAPQEDRSRPWRLQVSLHGNRPRTASTAGEESNPVTALRRFATHIAARSSARRTPGRSDRPRAVSALASVLALIGVAAISIAAPVQAEDLPPYAIESFKARTTE